jgi:hypothetical protein
MLMLWLSNPQYGPSLSCKPQNITSITVFIRSARRIHSRPWRSTYIHISNVNCGLNGPTVLRRTIDKWIRSNYRMKIDMRKRITRRKSLSKTTLFTTNHKRPSRHRTRAFDVRNTETTLWDITQPITLCLSLQREHN